MEPRRLAWIFGGVIVVFIGLVGATWRVLRSEDVQDTGAAPTDVAPRPFDAARWRSGSPTDRIAMARHMRDTQAHVGRPIGDVEAELGAARLGPGPRERVWYLGQRESGASLMFPYEESLMAELDEQGKVLRLRIVDRD